MNIENPKIMIVEDETITALLLKNKIAKLNYLPTNIIESGEEAIKQTGILNPDLILMDITLKGDMDGVKAASIIKSKYNIPIIFLTTSTDSKTLKRILETEPNGYIPKPIDDTVFKFYINMALNKHRIDIQLKESETKYRLLAETMNSGLAVVNPLGILSYVNKKMNEILNNDIDEIIGKPLLNVVGDANKKNFSKIINNNEIKNKTFEMVWTLDERQITVLVAVHTIIDHDDIFQGTLFVITDISDRKKIEEELRSSQRMLNMVMNNIPQAIFWKDKDLRYLGGNKVFLHETGLTSIDDLIGKNDFDMPWKDEAELYRKDDQIILKTGIAKLKHEEPQISKDNKTIWLRTSKIPIRDDTNQVVAVMGMNEDITDRKKSEQELQESEKRFRKIVERSPLPIAIIMINGEIEYINDKFITTFGYTFEETPTLESWQDKAFPDNNYKEKFKSIFVNAIQEAEITGNEIKPQEWKVKCKDETFKIIEFRYTSLTGRGLMILNDITELRKSEEELLKTTKIESLGILAGGIAHDFNNLLTTILGNISVAKINIDKTNKNFAILSEAEKGCIRARDLTHQLLTFSKGGEPVKKIISLKTLIKETAFFAMSGSNHNINISIPDDLWNANVDEGQISQVFHNLILNARQAMNQKGAITVTAENVVLDSSGNIPIAEGNYIKISISDQGHGISEENQQKIFDPYFTTKEKGTGLGLAVTYSIIHKHNGYINLESKIGEGTTFTFHLPATLEELDSQVEQEDKKSAWEGKILIMDDEEMILEVGSRILSSLGFEVDTVKNGHDMIDMYKKSLNNSEEYNLLIMDLTIPGSIGGKEVIKEILKINPHAKAIVSSGYSQDPVMANYHDYGFIGVIEKPYMVEDIKKVINDVL